MHSIERPTSDLHSKRDALISAGVPDHVGIIMDGNGRWAHARGQERLMGHREGAKALRRIIRECILLGISHLSVFAFSTENWQRPAREVTGLMSLMVDFATSEAEDLSSEGVRVVPIGDMDTLPAKTRIELERLAQYTASGDALTLLVAINYGGRAEIVRVVRELAEGIEEGSLSPEDICEELIRKHLYTHPYPDPDLIIRSGGEWRLSNFLLYQAAYSEFFSSPALWPDFDAEEFHRALWDYQRRQRRFGGLVDHGEDETG